MVKERNGHRDRRVWRDGPFIVLQRPRKETGIARGSGVREANRLFNDSSQVW